ncbi:MAG TPA: hypothetical protein VN937_06885 [Blastocatellia bacterium]|nr:hypothetical protein [Blastocatellia bacterium]
MSKAFIFGLVIGLALLGVFGVGASKLRQKNAEQEKEREELAEYQAELADATPVEVGVLSASERIHSGLYTDYKQRNSNATIDELLDVARSSTKIVKLDFYVGLGFLMEADKPERFFGELARSSDAIVRGRVTNKVSQLTEDDGFVFTDYNVEITEVLKDNVTAPLGASITVTYPGGKVLLDGVIVKARDHYFEPLPLNREVVLFLQSVKETGAYKPTAYSGSFQLDGVKLRALTEQELPPGVLRAESFLLTLRAVSNQ